MAILQKYLFETDFGAPRPSLAELAAAAMAAEQEAEPPPPTYSEEELTLTREQAFEQGRQAGIAETEAAAQHRLSLAITLAAQQLQELAVAQEAANEIILRDAIAVALAVVRKLSPEWTRVFGLTEIEAVIRECLHHLDREMRVAVRANPDELDAVKERIEKAAQAAAFEGKVLCLADARIAAGDCRVEWGDGGAERNQSHIWAEVDRIVTAALTSFGSIVEQTMQ